MISTLILVKHSQNLRGKCPPLAFPPDSHALTSSSIWRKFHTAESLMVSTDNGHVTLLFFYDVSVAFKNGVHTIHLDQEWPTRSQRAVCGREL